MSEAAITDTGDVLPGGTRGVVADFSADKQAFQVPWGKAMMWIFLLSDTSWPCPVPECLPDAHEAR